MSGQVEAVGRRSRSWKRTAQLAGLLAMALTLTGCVGLDPRFFACLLQRGPGELEACIKAFSLPRAAAPTGLTAASVDDGILLTRDQNSEEGVSGYRVSRGAVSGGPYVEIATVHLLPALRPSHLDRNVQLAVEYFYVVEAIKNGVLGFRSAQVTGIWRPGSADAPPAAPSGLTATPRESSVRLDWNDNTEADLAGYFVLRSIDPSGIPADRLPATGLVTVSEYVDVRLTNRTTYYYSVKAQDSGGKVSTASAIVSATVTDPPPAAPTGLAATPADSSVGLDWADNQEPDLEGYNVYRAPSGSGPFTKINATLVTVSMYVASGLPNGSTFDFYVAAVDASGQESSGSAVVSATPCAGCFTGAFWGALSRQSTAGQPAATRPRVSARRNTRPFQLTVAGRYSEGGRTSISGGSLVGKGLVFQGSFALRSGVTAFRGRWRSRIDWRLQLNARRGSSKGVALATFTNRKLGEACLRFKEAYVAKKRSRKVETRGSFTMLGGTAQAAKLLGGGSYRVLHRTNRTIVYSGKARAGKRTKALPSACRALRSRRP